MAGSKLIALTEETTVVDAMLGYVVKDPSGTPLSRKMTRANFLTSAPIISPVLTTPQINDTSSDHQYIFAASELVADRTVTLPLLTGGDTFAFEAHTQTFTNKTLTSPVLTTPQVNDTSADHQYVFAVSELAADRTVTLPLLTGADTFAFEDHAQTLANKTFTPHLTISDDANDAPLNITARSAAPLSPSTNDVYLDDGTNTLDGQPAFLVWVGLSWDGGPAAQAGTLGAVGSLDSSGVIVPSGQNLLNFSEVDGTLNINGFTGDDKPRLILNAISGQTDRIFEIDSDGGSDGDLLNFGPAGRLTVGDSASIAPLNLTERSAAPSSPSANDLYVDDGTNTTSSTPGWRRYTGATWEDVAANSGLGNVVEDTTPQLGAALDGQGFDLTSLGVVFLTEQAAAEANVAAQGQLWVKTATPNVLMFSDDAASDFQIATLTGTETLSAKTLTTPTVTPTMTVSDSATAAPFNITERSAAPSSPAANDLYVDDGTNTASGNPGWRRYTGAAWEDVAAAAGGGSVAGSDTQVQYNNGGAFGGATKLIYDDGSDEVYLGNGITSATPAGSVLNATGGSGTDIAGADLTHAAGQGTGAGAGGILHFQFAAAGVSGTSLNALADILTVGDDSDPSHATITSSGEFSNTGGQTNSEVFGDGATTSTSQSVAFGNTATAASKSVAIGYLADATSTESVAIGRGANAGTNNNATAINSTATGFFASSVGFGCTSTATGSVAIGSGCDATHDRTICIGSGADSTAANQCLLGGGTSAITAFYLGGGVTHATPSAIVVNATGGSGTNIAAADFTIAAAASTGTGAAGSLILQAAISDAGSGTTLNGLSTGFELTADASELLMGFFGATAIGQPAALTTQLTSITHTAPGTPDYALQDLVDSGVGSAFGFATKDEGNTLLSVVLNLQVRVQELEDALSAAGSGLGLVA